MTLEDLKLDERETHISQSADDRSKWVVYSDDAVMLTRIDKMMEKDDTITRESLGVGFQYTLSKRHVSLRVPRKVSDEERERLKAQLAKAREKQQKNKTLLPE